VKSYEVTIKEISDAGETRVASRWTMDKGPSAGMGRWSCSDNLGRDARNYSFEAGARGDLARFLRSEADKLDPRIDDDPE
jgi:hypothetical protein